MIRFARHMGLYLLPLLGLLVAEYLERGFLTQPLWLAYVALLMLAVATSFALFAAIAGEQHFSEVTIGLSVQAIGLIVLFALIFRDIGLVVSTGGSAQCVSFADALYFSMVTWTTLGYGDFQPPASLRLVASSEAMFGYVYMGIIVGLFSRAFK